MNKINRDIFAISLVVSMLLLLPNTIANAQEKGIGNNVLLGYHLSDDKELSPLYDVLAPIKADTLATDTTIMMTDGKEKRQKRDWNTWKPNPKRALWLSIVLPGAGQIYNRKYWKLPIVYGGMVGCVYAMRWNNMMYRDYSQAYMDMMDDDPNTHSYDQFLHLGNQINSSNEARYQDLFKQRKDRYRRWRDMSIFALIGVYAISIVDAYIDASLSEFDISEDLSLRVEPTIINDRTTRNPLKSSALGVQCSFNF